MTPSGLYRYNAATPMSILTVYLIALVLLSIWSGCLTYLYFKERQFFRQFTQGITKNDLKTVLKNIATSLTTIGKEINRLETRSNLIIKDSYPALQKIGFVRYNPFSDTGGDQSFCLCILDHHDNGFVLSSLHSREQTRIYAKAISGGKPKGYELSKEETEAVALALKHRP